MAAPRRSTCASKGTLLAVDAPTRRRRPRHRATGSFAIERRRLPLETLVEREAVPENGPWTICASRTRPVCSSCACCARPGMDGRVCILGRARVRSVPTATWMPTHGTGSTMVDCRVPDGARARPWHPCRAGRRAARRQSSADEAASRSARGSAWAVARFDLPRTGLRHGIPEHMEYAFAASGMGATGEAVLVAPEYVEGRLEWYDFEQGSGSLAATGTATTRRSFRIPAPLDFAGMPNPRFWTFEDPGVRFDRLDLLIESGQTSFAGDADGARLRAQLQRRLVPRADRARRWTIFETTTLPITDVFGDTTLASPPDGRWNMFRLDRHGIRPSVALVSRGRRPPKPTKARHRGGPPPCG